MSTIGTVNEDGQNVDLYIPRKCHASHRLIPSYDHGAIQIAIGDVDDNGVYSGTSQILCISGFLRSQGESDHAINHLCIGSGIIRGKTSRQPKWLKKRQAEARKKFANKKRRPVGKRPAGKRPAGKGARPAGKGAAGPRPEGKRGPRPEGKRAPRPEGKDGERKPRAPRPEGKDGKRPEGKRGPRPEGKRPAGKRPAAPAPAAKPTA